MAEPHRQLVIEEHVVLVCPHCWTTKEIAQEYPELVRYPISSRVCPFHFEVLLTRALEYPAPGRAA